MPEPILSVRGLAVAYGGIRAVKVIDLDVHEGELVTLIGANGAGKTTTLKAITGMLAPTAGSIEYQGRSIDGQPPFRLVEQGLAMVPEGGGVSARISILEKLHMGAFTRRDHAGIRDDFDRQFASFPRLRERATQLAG